MNSAQPSSHRGPPLWGEVIHTSSEGTGWGRKGALSLQDASWSCALRKNAPVPVGTPYFTSKFEKQLLDFKRENRSSCLTQPDSQALTPFVYSYLEPILFIWLLNSKQIRNCITRA